MAQAKGRRGKRRAKAGRGGKAVAKRRASSPASAVLTKRVAALQTENRQLRAEIAALRAELAGVRSATELAEPDALPALKF
jgi:cell division protein FtsB